MLAESLFPGSQAAQQLAAVGDLSLALLSGRVPVGSVPVNSFSALSQRAPANINQMLEAKSAAVPANMEGVLLPSADSAKSVAAIALDTMQYLQTGSVMVENAPSLWDGASSFVSSNFASGGFLLYPSAST